MAGIYKASTYPGAHPLADAAEPSVGGDVVTARFYLQQIHSLDARPKFGTKIACSLVRLDTRPHVPRSGTTWEGFLVSWYLVPMLGREMMIILSFSSLEISAK